MRATSSRSGGYRRVLGGRFAALLVACCAGCSPPMPPDVESAPKTVDPSGPIVVIGDTQRTSWHELAFFGREQNEDARRALIAQIAREERPAFIVHVGDLTERGADPENWQYFDRLVSPLKARGIPIHPILGNHDYWGVDAVALGEAFRRFPELAQRFYALRQGPLGLILLDSNLRGDEARAQLLYFEEQLSRYRDDATIRGIIVFTHHPPYTNGEGRSGDEYVLSELVPRFMREHKALAFISGHVHGYEHFVVGHKAFLVTGGGGGPRVEYRIDAFAQPRPVYAPNDTRRRPLNYVVISATDAAVTFTVKCLETDSACKKGELEHFTMAFPGRCAECTPCCSAATPNAAVCASPR